MTPSEFIQLIVEFFSSLIPSGASRGDLAVISLPLAVVAVAIIVWNSYGVGMALKVAGGLLSPFIGFAGVWMTLSIASRNFGGASLAMPGVLGHIYPYAVTFWYVPALITLVTALAVANGLSWILVELYTRITTTKCVQTPEERSFRAANRFSGETKRPSLLMQWFDLIDGYIYYWTDEIRQVEATGIIKRLKERQQRS